jgi:hypothetical protein
VNSNRGLQFGPLGNGRCGTFSVWEVGTGTGRLGNLRSRSLSCRLSRTRRRLNPAKVRASVLKMFRSINAKWLMEHLNH